MPSSRCRKLSQPSCTAPAVQPVRCVLAEPQGSASFTYLQVHSQVLHVIPFKAWPGEHQWFSAVEKCSLRCCGLAVRGLPALRPGSSFGMQSLFFAAVNKCDFVTLGKIQHSLLIEPAKRTPVPGIVYPCRTGLREFSGYSFRQNPCQQDYYPQIVQAYKSANLCIIRKNDIAQS
jgi:hypothetical protein